MEKGFRETPLWDNALSLEERLDFLLGELTLEEKIACMGTGNPEISRLGVPAFHVGGEAAHGVQARHDQEFDLGTPDFTTIFPNPIGMSATWDEALIRQAGEVVSTEARGLFSRKQEGCLSMWAPTVDMERDPRWGRTEEAYGEDPLLTGKMAGAYVEGLQGDDAFYLRTAATLKHFYANNVEEGRVWKSSSIDERNKWEYYLEPFRQIITEHGAEAVMTSYNEINGVPAMLNPEVQRLLKDEWGLRHVVCDGADVSQTVEQHHYYDNHADTIAAGLAAGIDCFTDELEMVTDAVRTALEQDKITEEDIDRALRCHFSTLFRLGLFDGAEENPYARITMEQVGTKEHHDIARKVSTEGIVLLQNRAISECVRTELDSVSSGGQETQQAGEKLLPLDLSKKIAVIGPLADKWYKDWYTGLPPYHVTPLQGLKMVYDGGEAETAVMQVRIRLEDDVYMGLDEEGRVYRCDAQHAEIFEMDCWDGEQVTLRSMKNGKLLTVEDDFNKGQKGYVTATKEEAYGWFVREVFHIRNRETGASAITTEDGLCEDALLCAWNDAVFRIDGQGRLCVVEKDEFTGNDGETETGGLPIYPEIVRDGIAAAKDIAAEADTVVLFLGANPVITCKEEIDRKNLCLPVYQSRLMQEVYKVNANIVLVLVSSVPFGIDWAKDHIPAILVSATGGMELGNALADVLTGKVSPAGRLPMTWYSEEEVLPDMDDYDIIQGERTYQYFRGKPLYPFGHGLTYGDIQYDEMTVEIQGENGLETALQVTVSLQNKGTHITDEVVQLYGHKMGSALKRPEKQLLDFVRVKDIQPGECREVTMCVPVERLYYYEVIQEKMILEDGQYKIMAGGSSEALPLDRTILLKGEGRGCRKAGKAFRVTSFDRCENGLLVENNGWIPDGLTLVKPKEGKTLRLMYDCVEIPDGENEEKKISLEVSFREEGAWNLSARLGKCMYGTAKSAPSAGASMNDEGSVHDEGKGNGEKAACRHYRGMPAEMKKISIDFNMESSKESGMAKLIVEAEGFISPGELRIVSK
ncbi:MAG: glycoside hydrolase family 3 C-terminal domain-containing protein [Lachnospiraceae bacterium]|nr:glycoside hydrolase family 3 C-terminal domain-containing protein [Lachnospiraceae bacterium]